MIWLKLIRLAGSTIPLPMMGEADGAADAATEGTGIGTPVLGLATVAVVDRSGCVGDGLGPHSAPPGAVKPGSVNACTSTGKTSPAEIYLSGRVTGFPNSTLASNS